MSKTDQTASCEHDPRDSRESAPRDVTLPDLAPLQDQEAILRKEAIEEQFPSKRVLAPTEAMRLVAGRMLCGALVGFALACIYSLYSQLSPLLVAGGVLYGALTAFALISGSAAAQNSLKYVVLDAPIAGLVIAVLAIAAPQTIAQVMTISFLSQTFWSGVCIGLVGVSSALLLVLKIIEIRRGDKATEESEQESEQ